MTQISRPFQLALVAMGLFALVWFVALRGHAVGSSPPGASSPSSAASNPAAATPVYHGKAPGVEGLTRAIDKAHGAVAQSEQNAKQLQEKSAQASRSGPTGAAPGVATPTSRPASPVASKSPATTHPSTTHPSLPSHPAARHKAAPSHPGTPITGPNRLPAMQALVEDELKQGKVAVLLFWSPKGADDVAVHGELQVLLAAHRQVRASYHVPLVRRLVKAVGLELNKKIAVHYASASQVASFGSFTRTVQVYQTPTIVIVNKAGKTRTLTGLVDAYSIEQTIDEARHS